MASEIIWTYRTGASGYALLRSSSGTIFNRVGGAFEAYTATNYFDYQLSGREQSSGSTYTADFPTAITTPGYYNLEARDQVAGSGLQSDQVVSEGELWWNGGAVIPAVDLRSGQVATSGTIPTSGFATAVQVSGVATGFAFVSGVFVQSGIATSVQVSGLATYANISGITQAFVSGALFASGGAVGWLLSGAASLSGIVANSGIFIQSGIATSVQVSGLMPASGVFRDNVSGALPASGFATAVQVSGLAPWASVSGLYAFLPIRLVKGRSFSNFPFPFYSSGTTAGLTSGTPISGQISRDGGAFGLLQSGSFLEIGFGWYNCQYLTSGDLAADSIALRFNCSGADVRDVTIITQPN